MLQVLSSIEADHNQKIEAYFKQLGGEEIFKADIFNGAAPAGFQVAATHDTGYRMPFIRLEVIPLRPWEQGRVADCKPQTLRSAKINILNIPHLENYAHLIMDGVPNLLWAPRKITNFQPFPNGTQAGLIYLQCA